MTIEQLNQIKEKNHELVMVRKIIKEEGEKLASWGIDFITTNILE